jgi:hypothetical protein
MAKNDTSSARLDLREAVHSEVLHNQRPPTGQAWLLEVDGLLHLYHHEDDLFLSDRFSRRLRAEQGWFEKLTSHAPTVGTFYEDALRAVVAEVLPANLTAGTGFVFDPHTRSCSKQIDILIYDSTRIAPLYRRGEFAIVTPGMAIFHSEVKKTLRPTGLRSTISTFLGCPLGTRPDDFSGVHRIAIFAYSSRSSTASLLHLVAAQLRSHVEKFHAMTKSGCQASFMMYNITLPQIYLFDRNEYIETRLAAEPDGWFKLMAEKYHTEGDNGLGVYLSQMVSHSTARIAFDERDFITSPLKNDGDLVEIASGLRLVQRLPMIKLKSLFPRDEAILRGFRVAGKRPHMALIPSSRDLSGVKSFEQLLSGKVFWLFGNGDLGDSPI